MSETEKITINLGLVDLLGQEGFYSNRTGIIRTAIRNQLATHADEVRQTVARKTLVLGLEDYTCRGRASGGHEYTRYSYKGEDGTELAERWSVHGLVHGPRGFRRLGRDGAFLPAAPEAVAGTNLRTGI